MAVTITNPLPAATGVTATVSSGGSLTSGTTYYCSVVATYGYGTTANAGTYYATNYGVPSVEVSGTTTSTDKTITISWSAVPGAEGYFVYRTTTAGDYDEGVGHYMRQGALTSYLYASTAGAGTTYVDNGSITPLRVWFFEYGLPVATISGSTEAAPDTEGTLYNAMVAAGFSNNCQRSGGLGETTFTNYEMKVFIEIDNGWFKINTKRDFLHIGSISFINNSGGFSLGIPNDNAPKNGGIYRRLFGYTAWASSSDTTIKMYDSHMCDFKDDFGSTSAVSGLYSWWYFNMTGTFICDCSTFNLASFNFTNNYGYIKNTAVVNSANYGIATGKMPTSNVTLSECSYGGIACYYATENPVLKDTKVLSVNVSDMFFHKDTNVVSVDAINHQFTSEPPSATASSNPQNITVRRKYEMKLQLVDNVNTPISGASVTLTNVSGTTITMEPSTTDGYVYLASGIASSGSTATLIDSSKNWTTNAYTDYLVEIYAGTGIGQEYSIKSNTSNTITLKGVWTTIPNNTSKYRIIPHIHTHSYKGKATAPYYDTTEFFPHTLTISKGGYETYTSKFKAVDKMCQVLTLEPKVDVMIDTNGHSYIKLDKDIITSL